MKRLSVCIAAIVFGLSLAPAAFALTLPCYCKYGASKAGWDSDSARFCPNETYFSGTVDAGTFPLSYGSTADDNCQARCASEGSAFVDITTVSPSQWASFGSSDNLVLAEKSYCVLRSDSAATVQGWSSSYLSCKKPLNSIVYKDNPTGQVPDSCSYCFCKFKTGGSTPSSCSGKTTMVHITGDASTCSNICTSFGLDNGDSTKDYGSHCDFQLSDQCAKPLNPDGSGCQSELGAISDQKKADAFQASHGTALGLTLPLGDITFPQLIGRVIKQLLGIVGALALVFFIWGGLKYMTAQGDDKKIKEARDMIVAAISGLAAIFLSYALLTLLINTLSK